MIRQALLTLSIVLTLTACATQAPTMASADPPELDRNCLQESGSRIKRAAGECLPTAGRSYSQRDLRKTGAFNAAEALILLDPAVSSVGR